MTDKKGEQVEGTLGERPDDAHPGTKVGGFEGDQSSDTQTADTPPPPPPTDPGGGQSHDPKQDGGGQG